MRTEIIWYKSAPSNTTRSMLANALSVAGIDISEENRTVSAQQFPKLLSQSLNRSRMVIIIGGLNQIRDEENIVFILKKCIRMPLEMGRESRSSYIYDPVRSKQLPSFDRAVLFPAQDGVPEGFFITSGPQAILCLPDDENALYEMLPTVGDYIAGILYPAKPKEEPKLPDGVRSSKERIEEVNRRRAERELQMQPQEKSLRASDMRMSLRRMIDGNMPEAEESNLADRSEIAARSTRFGKPRRAAKTRKMNTSSLAAVRAVSLAIIALLIGATTYFATVLYEPARSIAPTEYQTELAKLYSDGGTINSDMPDGALAQFSKLYAANDDVRGFITVPGTQISLPVMQSETEPDYYTSHDFYMHSDSRGSLYFSAENTIAKDASNRNLVIYGSSPTDDTLFAQLENYRDADFFAGNPVIRMDTLYEKQQWRVFAVCIVSSDTISEFNYANTSFIGKYAMEKHLYELFIRSLFYTQCDVFPTDSLLTLVTDCDEFAGAKLLVVARPLREEEDISTAGEGIIENPIVLMPDVWYDMKGEEMPDVPELDLEEDYDTPDEDMSTTEDITTTSTTGSTTASQTTSSTQSTSKSTTKTTTKKKTTTTTVADTSAPTDAHTTANSEYVSGGDATTAPTTSQSTTTTAKDTSNPTTLPPGKYPATMRITSNGKVIEKDTATVLAMIVEAEMSSANHIEALKAQAVAAYTFYKYSGGAAKAPSFPTKSKPGARVKQAVAAVLGQYMTVGGKVKYTPYSAISAGMSASNYTVNGTKLSHLVEVECPSDKNEKNYKVTKTVKASTVASKVKSKKGINLYSISDKNKWFKILERDKNGLYVTKVQVGSKTYRGSTLYLSILGYTCLRSPCFDIKYDKSSDSFIFTSYGYGHGVGMSQRGAQAYAKQGKNYVWILQHFYKGCKIVS